MLDTASPPLVVTGKRLAAILDCSVDAIVTLRNDPDFPRVILLNQYRYNVDKVLRYLEQQAKNPHAVAKARRDTTLGKARERAQLEAKARQNRMAAERQAATERRRSGAKKTKRKATKRKAAKRRTQQR